MESSKRANIAKELKSPRVRLVLIATSVIIVVVLAAAWAIMAKRSRDTAAELAGAVAPPPTMGATSGMHDGQPGVATNEYDGLVVAGNKAEAEAAKAEGTSAIPTPRATADTPSFDGAGQTQGDVTAPVASSPQNDPAESERRRQAWEQQVQARVAAMRGQMQKMDRYWAIHPHEHFQVAEGNVAAPPETSEVQAQRETPSGPDAARRSNDLAMGDVLYGTLDFAINTDDPASANFIQATIRQPGPFQGAKVLGSLQEGDQYAKTVGIHFTQMKVQGEVGMRTIDAWAVSPDTQRTSLASDVNNHYASRSMSVLVGSFLEGYSQALLTGGRQQNIITTPNALVVQQDAYSAKQLAQIGAGNVGKGMSQMFAQAATRQKTISVNAGADLGVWFLKDVEQPGR